jgi:altronate dehydratase
VEVADGKLTKSEALGFYEMAIARVCNYCVEPGEKED